MILNQAFESQLMNHKIKNRNVLKLRLSQTINIKKLQLKKQLYFFHLERQFMYF
ncbi:unnamed protein product [Paramecium sonneborni]|uniref:Uncharacterized protein n=1 Tax=Paramecium sonneborni TaxID=65129 RepID=A0A8S1MU89_9CILI|nr:unnamed protein product [Paramecium sonneborni]